MGYIIKTPFRNTLIAIQKQKAAYLVRLAGYDALQSSAQLDTKAGRAVYSSYENIAICIEKGNYLKGDKSYIPLPHGIGGITVERV